MRRLPIFLLAVPLFSQQTTLPGDAPTQTLNHPPNAATQFLSSNAGWQAASTQANAIFLKDPSSTKQAAILGNVAHQDPTSGAWVANDASLSSTANGWRIDGGAYQVFIRQAAAAATAAAQHVVTQTYTDYATKHASTLNFTVPTLTYNKNFTFSFTQDGLPWKLIFTSQGFFQIRSTVATRIGKATHSFPVTSSEALSVNSEGQLVGNAHVGLTAPMIIPRFGKPVACSGWSYAKGVASFTCDDSSLKDNQLPYIIDPQSQTTLTDSGTYNIYNWSGGGDGGSQDAYIPLSLTALPSDALILAVGCGNNVLDSSLVDGDDVSCHLQTLPPFAPVSIACGGASWPCQSGFPSTTSTSITVDVGIDVNNSYASQGNSYSDSADVNDVQLAITYTTFSLPSGAYANGTQVSVGAAGLSATSTVSVSGTAPNYGTCSPSYSPCPFSSSGTSFNPIVSATVTLPATTVTLTAYNNGSYFMCQYNGCGIYTVLLGVASATYSPLPPVATPTISPAGAISATPVTVSMSDSTPNTTIHYTTDGSSPSIYSPTYTGPFALSSTTNAHATVYTVQAEAYASGYTPSAASTQITITGTVGAPVFTPPGGLYSAGQTLSLTSVTANAAIRYTTDGSAPTETHGVLYSGPILVATNGTIKAIAYETNWTDSAVSAATYYFQNATGGTGNGGGGSGGGSNTGAPPGDSGNGLDPRRTGVRASGSYWGDAGENLDTISGNLSFSNPLIKPFGRGNWSLPFNLSYNSQMWRNDSAGDWLMGADVGYGMGWKLQVGSITAIWSGSSTIDHYVFTDSSGAEYSLNVNTGGVWTSTEGIYISFVPASNRLYFNDGSYWVMGCTSASGEQDAGTMYPTLAENPNGNQITITYLAGIGSSAPNTSARFSTVVDTRMTYRFTYTQLSANDNIPHLTSVSGAPGESWVLAYTSSSLAAPVSGAAYGSTELLTSLSWPAQVSTATFSYNSSAEMTQYVTALGGSISWSYASNTYSGNVTLREVSTRSMNQGAGGFTNFHTLSHPSSCDPAGGPFHACTYITDAGAGSVKRYYAAAQNSMVLPSQYQETDNDGSTVLLQKNLTWSQNADGAEYLSRVDSTLNPGASYAATTSTVQTIDRYGNLTQQQVYDYGSGTVSRTYNFTYVTDTNYTSRYMRSLVSQVTVTTTGNSPITLATYGYDGTATGSLYTWNLGPYPQHDASYDNTVTYRGNVTSSWKMGTSVGYAYDIAGNVYQMKDGDGMTIATVTDTSTGSVPSLLTPNANSNLATSMAYSAYLQPISVIGANSATQSQSFDSYNRLTSTTSVDGAVTNFTYTLYPSANTQTATTQTTAGTINNGTVTYSTANTWKRNTYDGFGRVIKVETGHDSTTVNTVDTVYDACGCSPLGKVKQVSMPYGPGETEVWTTYTYDGSGRQLTSTAPDGSVTTTSYNGNAVTTTDPAGIWKTNISDAFGNLAAVYEPDPATGSPTTGPTTTYAYNGANQLTNVYMTRGGVTQNRSFSYNGSDLVSETTPEGGTVTYTYDLNHHVTSRIDALNQPTGYTYDAYERLTMVQHYQWWTTCSYPYTCPGWIDQSQQDVSYYYDTPVAGDYTQNYTWGRLSAVVFQSSTGPGASFAYEYSYNQAGRITGNRMLVNAGSVGINLDLQAQYMWDNVGRMTSMTYPSGPAVSYQYDAMSRATSMIGSAGGATATYGSAGQVLTLSGYNGSYMNETRTYNSMLQLVHLTGAAGGYGATASMDMQYVYNTGHNNGRVTQTIDNVLGETVNYSYDWLHRLTGASATNGSWGEAYAYDGFGNLTAKAPTAGSAPAYTGSSGSNNTGGSLANATWAPSSWDIENRLVGPGYAYDPWGRRVWTQMANNTISPTYEVYFYGATGQKLESYGCNMGRAAGTGADWKGRTRISRGRWCRRRECTC